MVLIELIDSEHNNYNKIKNINTNTNTNTNINKDNRSKFEKANIFEKILMILYVLFIVVFIIFSFFLLIISPYYFIKLFIEGIFFNSNSYNSKRLDPSFLRIIYNFR